MIYEKQISHRINERGVLFKEYQNHKQIKTLYIIPEHVMHLNEKTLGLSQIPKSKTA